MLTDMECVRRSGGSIDRRLNGPQSTQTVQQGVDVAIVGVSGRLSTLVRAFSNTPSRQCLLQSVIKKGTFGLPLLT